MKIQKPISGFLSTLILTSCLQFLYASYEVDLLAFALSGKCDGNLSGMFLGQICQQLNRAGKKINLKGADLRGAVFAGYKIKNINLENANLCGANFAGCSIKQSCLKNTSLCGANFVGSILQEVDFSRSKMPGINFTDSYIKKCNYSHVFGKCANFLASTLNEITFSKSLLESANFANCALSGCHFSHAILYKAVFNNGLLLKCTFNRSKIDDVNFKNNHIRRSDLSNIAFNYAKNSCTFKNALFYNTKMNPEQKPLLYRVQLANIIFVKN
ncbi:MAG: pentapeptide repeat-containing protein [Candidatus Babeliaceae bacterium]